MSGEKIEVRPMGNEIPRMLHQIYLAGEHTIPTEIKKSRDRLIASNPNWTFRLYDNVSAEEFIQKYYGGKILRVYRRISPEYYAARADLLRYLIMYEFGGLYLDIKSWVSLPLSQVVKENEIFLFGHWPNRSADQAGFGWGRHPQIDAVFSRGEICNWFIASVRGHPFMGAVLDSVVDRIEKYKPWRDGTGKFGVLKLTGPIVYSNAIAPILDIYPHTVIEFDERGIEYTIFNDASGGAGAGHLRSYREAYYGFNRSPIICSDQSIDRLIYFVFRAFRPIKSAGYFIKKWNQ